MSQAATELFCTLLAAGLFETVVCSDVRVLEARRQQYTLRDVVA